MGLKRGSISGKFVMVDGLDGSGKGTIVEGLRKWAEKRGLRVFDLREYCKRHGKLPEIDELDDYEVILSAEPTYSHIGRSIRTEIIYDNKREYSALTTAQAFALDRKILYKKVILPALERGMHIFQERGVVTSLVYQPLQLEELMVGQLTSIPGNKFALNNAPDLLIITMLNAEEAMTRLFERNDKRDNAIFEKLEFQKRVKDVYTSDWLRELFTNKGTKVIYLDTSEPKSPLDTEAEAIKVFERFLRSEPQQFLKN